MLSRITFLFILLFAKITFSQELTATQKFPEKLEPGHTYIVETKIVKTNFSGFMRFAQELPDDFSAIGIETKGGSFTFGDNMIKVVWLTPPSELDFTITYKLTIPADAKGKYVIRGKMSYIIDNERRNYELETIEIRVGNIATAKTETPKTETPKTEVAKTEMPKAETPKKETQPVVETKPKTENKVSLPSTSTTPTTAAATGGRRYKVQIGAYSQKPKIEGVPEISTLVLDNGITKYFSGNFSTYEKAVKRKNEMAEKGFQGAFIVQFENGKIVK
jgi:hypothetical protein